MSLSQGNPAIEKLFLQERPNKYKKKYIDNLKAFKNFFKEATFPYQSLSLDGKLLSVNKYWLDMLGYEENEVIGKSFFNFMDSKDLKEFEEKYSNFIEAKTIKKFEVNLKTKDNKQINVEVDRIIVNTNLKDEVHCILQNITNKKKLQKKMKQALVIFENTNEGIIITNKNNKIISVNKAFCKITQYNEEEVIGKDPKILSSKKHDDEFYSHMWEHLNIYGSWIGEVFNKRKNGELYPEWLSISVIKNEKGEIENYIALFSDIKRLKETETKVSYLKNNDTLTKLPNRSLLNVRLNQAMHKAYESYSNLAVLSINIDNLKNINDSYGYSVGNEVIITLSKRLKRLKKAIKSNDIIARTSGDEFIIVLEDIGRIDVLLSVVDRIQNSIKEKMNINEYSISITSCIGISIYPNHGIKVNDLIKHSETALHNAKKLGKSQYQIYSQHMTQEAVGKLQIEQEINEAIKSNDFEVFFQPQIDIHSKKIIGAEALLRWNHKEKGILTPDEFLDYLEISENIIPVGEKVLKNACEFFQDLHEEGILLNGKVAVNLSAIQINNSKIVETVKNALEESKLNPKNLELEVVETSILQDTKKTISLFDELKDLDVKLAIDDFGTGYSSFSYIKQFPIDKLKIDKSFIKDIITNKKDKAIVEAIIALGKGLDLKVIAEGVENTFQENYLKKNTNCDEIQGWLYSKALSKDEFRDFVINYKN